jgi:polysaccharide export outer membrane protein
MRKAIWFAISAALPVIFLGLAVAAQDSPAHPNPAPAAQTQASAPDSAAPAKTDAGDPTKLAAPATRPTTPDDNTFIMGPEDQIEIFIWADPRIGGTYLVRPDGKISMNLLGEIQVAGRTPAGLASDISDMLKQREIVRRPEVNVKVLAINSRKFSINGEVMKTGAFPLVVPTRIMDALVNAGGFKDFANKKSIVIMRGDKRLKFNWNEVIKGKKTEQNVFLEPGDIIIVK